MCLAYPGKIVKIKNDIAIIDYETEKRTAKVIGDFKVGEYVIAQGGIVVQKIPEDEALQFIKMVKQKEAVDRG